MTFDVAGEKGLKKRFFIEQVESQTAETATLFKMNDLTQIVIAEKGLSPVGSISQQDIELSLAPTPHPQVTAMAFASLVALVSLAAAVTAAPASTKATCPDGTQVNNEACCAFVPVGVKFLQATIWC